MAAVPCTGDFGQSHTMLAFLVEPVKSPGTNSICNYIWLLILVLVYFYSPTLWLFWSVTMLFLVALV